MHLPRRRIVSVLFLVLILVGAYLICNHLNSRKDNTVNYIPNKAALVIKVPLKHFNLTNVISPTSYWNQLSNIPIINKVTGQLIDFESLMHEDKLVKSLIGASNFYVSAFATKSENFGLLYTVKLDSKHNSDSLQSAVLKMLNQVEIKSKRNFNGEAIIEYKLKDKRDFSFVVIDNYFIGSFTSFLVDDAVSQYKSKLTLGFQDELSSGLNISDNKLEIVWIYKNAPEFLKIFTDKRGGVSGIDVIEFYSVMSNYQIIIDSSGITGFSNKELFSDLSFVNHYRGQEAIKSLLFELLPVSTSVVKQVSVSNIINWVQNLKGDRSKLISGYSIEEYLEGLNNKYKIDIKTYLTSWCTGNYAQVIIEPFNSNYNEFVFAFFEADDIDIANMQLKELAIRTSIGNNLIAEPYNGTEISSIDIQGVLPLLYGNIFNKVQSLNCMTYDDYVIFGNSVGALKILIDELNSGNKLLNKLSLKEKDLINRSNINYLFYSNLSNSENILSAHINEKWFTNYTEAKDELSSINSFIYSYNFNLGNPTSNFLLSFWENDASTIKLAWKKQFENDLATKPFLMKSKSSKIFKILVQDVDNNLFCIDELGEVLWQKNISEKILNNIEAIDIRADGQIQYLFNTRNSVYLIDEKGANVLNYPIKLPHETTNELVFVNNTQTKELSFYVYCSNKQIYAYNVNGRPLSNWKLRSKSIELSRNFQCVVQSGVPLIILSYSNGMIEFINPNGDIIKKYTYDEAMSTNNIFYCEEQDDTKWTSTDRFGNIITLLAQGDLKVIPNPTLSENHYFTYTDIDNDLNSDLIYLDDDELTAYDQDMIMIMYKKFSQDIDAFVTVNSILKNDKRIGVVSKESNKIYMFDSDGINFNGFPVEGSSEFSVLDLQNSGYLNLICTSDNNKLINYRIK